LGDTFVIEIEKQNQVVNDPVLQGYVEKIGRRLLTGAREVSFAYTFKVVKDNSINAFAVPGGHLYVNTGLIKASQSESELAAVLAHEISHAVARHGTRQMTQQYGYSLVLSLVLGQNPNLLAQMAAELFGKAGMMSYSRDYENQADFLGVETLYKTGYNPQGMVTFFQKIDTGSQAKSASISKYFSTHPLTSERIQRVKDQIAALPPRIYPTDDQAELKLIKARIP